MNSRQIAMAWFVLSAVLVGSRPVGAIEAQFRFDPFANEFWIIDQLSSWERDSRPAYRQAFEKRFKISADRQKLLNAYAKVRQTRSRDASITPSVEYPFGDRLLTPPRLPSMVFAHAFLAAKNEVDAARTLGLDEQETRAVTDVFAAFRSDLRKILTQAQPWLQAKDTMSALATQARVNEFIGMVSTFCGAASALPPTVYVDILWSPTPTGASFNFGNHLALPFGESSTNDRRDLASKVGVAVHEFGHFCVSSLPDEVRQQLTNQFFEHSGLVNRQHPNIIDEAIETALGNIVFMRDRLPEFFDVTSFYDYETDKEYPHAIDTLARALEPVVRQALVVPNGYRTTVVPAALALQKQLFGHSPRHRSHVALVLATRLPLRYFNGLFWGVSRFNYSPSDLRQFIEDSNKNPDIDRWIIMTEADARRNDLLARSGVTHKRLRLPADKSACVTATRRKTDRGFDFVLLGKDEDALRRLLIAVHGMVGIPSKQPYCITSSGAGQRSSMKRVAR